MQMDEDVGYRSGPRAGSRRDYADDDAGTLHDRLAARRRPDRRGAERACRRPRATPQPQAGVTYARKIDKRETELDWTRPAAEPRARGACLSADARRRRALYGEPLKIWRARSWMSA